MGAARLESCAVIYVIYAASNRRSYENWVLYWAVESGHYQKGETSTRCSAPITSSKLDEYAGSAASYRGQGRTRDIKRIHELDS